MMTTETEYFHLPIDDGRPKHPLDAQMEAEAGMILCQVSKEKKVDASWYIEADHRTGVLRIECPEFHMKGNQHFGFLLPLDKLTDAGVRRREIYMAGGELLERAFVQNNGQRSRIEVDRA